MTGSLDWEPPNIFAQCPTHANLTACTPFGIMYLHLIQQLYGSAPDHAPVPADEETFDFIVVGAGAAGAIVASRLSEIEQWKVLLLEAGPEQPEITNIPALYMTLPGSNIDWQYRIQPSDFAFLAAPDRRSACPRGKVMGGSTSINAMLYVRGNRADYDGWAAAGNPGWSYNEVLPYFKKSEHNMNIEYLDPKYHGVDGPVSVAVLPYVDEPSIMISEAFDEIGLPVNDCNGAFQQGTMQSQDTWSAGLRYSTNNAYIKPVRYTRINLSVSPEAYVIKILFDEHKRATGVKYIKKGLIYTAYATKEVIVSGGVINSPQLLMLSGIGPSKHLEDLHIPVIADLPVGENFHDHVTFEGLLIALSNRTATTVSQVEAIKAIYEYKNMKVKRGPLTGNGPQSSLSFFSTGLDGDAPDIEVAHEGKLWRQFLREPMMYDGVDVLPTTFYDSVSVRVVNLTPRSRGRILLNATNPYSYPLIYANYLADPRDTAVLLKGIEKVLTLEYTHAFKSRGVHFIRNPKMPACQYLPWGTDAYFECLIKMYTSAYGHIVGTCKMGPAEDPTAVVDPRLNVYGVSGLRVVDASVMPVAPRGNTMAPTMMVAERGVSFILEDWQNRRS